MGEAPEPTPATRVSHKLSAAIEAEDEDGDGIPDLKAVPSVESCHSGPSWFGLPAKKAWAEFVGTFLFVFIGCSSAINGGQILQIALTFGFAIFVLAHTIGHHSGGAPRLLRASTGSSVCSRHRSTEHCGDIRTGGYWRREATPRTPQLHRST